MYMNKYTIKKGDKTVTVKELKERIDYMDNTEALTLTPKRLFIPLGGIWTNLDCEPLDSYNKIGVYYGQNGYAITATSENILLKGKFPCKGILRSKLETGDIEFDFSISDSLDKIEYEMERNRYVVKLPLVVKVAYWKTREQCKENGCKYYNSCNLLKKLENGDIIENVGAGRHVRIVYKIEFDKEELKKQATISDYLNMDMEFGQNKDQNLVSTVMGIAVMNEDGWRIFDSKENTITNINVVKNKNIFPIYVMPATNVRVGDLIKESGEYYYVTEAYNNNLITVNAKTGEMKAIKPHQDVRGKKYYIKLTSFMDFLNVGGDSNLLKMMMLMDKINNS